MCGFSGFWSGAGHDNSALGGMAERMAQTLRHRGPDSSGFWTSSSAGIAFSHRRLAILDLSPAGHQPMVSPSKRYIITFNGEIYNHAALRGEMEAAGENISWQGHSDTETLLNSIELWGLKTTLQRTNGMFAFALWDQQEKTLFLARDRLGEKPLYYGWVGRDFVFSSELKALRAHSDFANPVCRQSLAEYLRFMYVPAPRSIYQGIFKLEPGCLMTVRGSPPSHAPAEPLRPTDTYANISIHRWWSLGEVVEKGAHAPITDEREALDALENCLSDAVKMQSLADVPLGAFLSGGVDSSTIVALMQKQTSRPVKTFTVGFEDAEFDESKAARTVAAHLQTEHTEVFVTSAETQAVVPRLSSMYDEPFADSSQIPTYLVCAAARQEVTVALSGDAGDELFGGYNRYFWGPRIWNKVGGLPFTARQVIAEALTSVSPAGWNRAGKLVNKVLPGDKGIARLGEKAHKLGNCLKGARDLDDLYMRLVSQWQDPARLVFGENGSVVDPSCPQFDPLPSAGMDNDSLRMMYRDSLSFLPDDILCKVDRAAMAISLETRVPFLDNRVVEMAWRLPLSMKIRGNQSKWALRKILYRHVPRELIERPKVGFAIPLADWLRGPLRVWAEDLLDERRLHREGYLNPGPIRNIWKQHLSERHDYTEKLWGILMFQAWLEDNS